MKKQCLNCKNRSSNCHATCKEYADFATWREEQRERTRAQKIADTYFRENKRRNK